MKKNSAILGAAFLMATSAIGPGFLNNTSLFTQQLLSSFGFVILVSVLIDIFAQLNTWRIITAGELRASELANRFLPGSGYVLSILVVFGGLAFNVGNIAGCGMGLQVLTGMDARWGAGISALVALFIFWSKDAGKRIDGVVKILGLAMIGLSVYVMFVSHPPYLKALRNSFFPSSIDLKMIVALVGGTVGGYISFAGAHRLLDAGIKGTGSLKQVNKSAVSGILVTAIMRFVLFLCALGVVSNGGILGKSNPAASVFQLAAGEAGYKFFGLVLWAAAITSVIGASYTSVSFMRSFHRRLEEKEKWVISIFIVTCTIVFILLKQTPSSILVMAGLLNGFILPLGLAILLLAVNDRKLFPVYRHSLFLQVAGWIVVVLMTWMSIASL
ncbi:MAG: divalent metal cation transporter [Chitinophagaceae bacterium]|nr:divalent metal cation transporter [Chitinophagaceae bacterium]